MAKLIVSDLAKIKEKIMTANNIRESNFNVNIIVHLGTCGIASGARTILNIIMNELEKSERKDIIISTSGCIGLCSAEPLVTIKKNFEEPIKYSCVDAYKMGQIFNLHVLKNEIQTQWVYENDAKTPLEKC